MKKADELSNPDSCLNRAADDEPLFVLKATDALAPTLVREWVARYIHDKVRNKSFGPREVAKADEAFTVAEQMEDWNRMQRARRARQRGRPI